MKSKLLVLSLVLVLVTLPFMGACAKPAPAPAPVPVPAPAPAPAPAPTPAPAPPPSSAETVTWTFNWDAPYKWWYSALWRPGGRFQMMLEERTGGRFKFDVKQKMFPPREIISAIGDGRIQIGETRLAWISGTFPLWDYQSLPFWWDSAYEYEKTEWDPRIREIWDKTYREAGVVKLAPIVSMPNSIIFSHDPIRTLDDLKGKKIRTSGAMQTDAMRAMGASPLTIPAAEIEQAIYRGTVDGILTSLVFGVQRGMMELTEYMSVWPVTGIFDIALLVNAEAFDALPNDLRQALVDTAREVSQQEFYAAQSSVGGLETLIKALGRDFIYPDPEEIEKAKQLTNPVVDNWVKNAGPYAQEVLNISKEYASGAR